MRGIDALLGIEGLPNTFFYTVVSNNDLVLVGNRFYTIEGTEPQNRDHLCWLSKKLGLEASETLENMEKVYFETCEKEILAYIDSLIKDRVDLFKQDINKKADYFSNLDNCKMRIFMIKEVFPLYFKEPHKDFIKNITFEVGNESQEVQEPEDKKTFSLNFLKEGSSIFEEYVLEGKNLAIIDKEWYDLKDCSLSKPRVYLDVKGRRYSLNGISNMTIESIEKAYKERLKQRIEEVVLDENNGFLKEIENLQKEGEVYAFAQKEAYQTENVGYLTKNGQTYIYNQIEPFVLESSQGNLYYFKGFKIGLSLYIDSRGKINYQRQIMIFDEKCPHPANHESLKPFSPICTGNTDMRSIYSLATPHALAVLLDISESFMIEAVNLRYLIDKPAYRDKLISREEVIQRNLRITNAL